LLEQRREIEKSKNGEKRKFFFLTTERKKNQKHLFSLFTPPRR